ncbi:MAG TPA: beta-galactosidase GalA [Gemmatimonadaceae bacterium]
MPKWTRRDLFKTGLGIAASTVLTPSLADALESTAAVGMTQNDAPPASTPRERLLLDADWKFHLGDANDVARDFGFGGNEAFAKAGALFPGVSRANFDATSWRSVTLPHDWAVELPFVNEQRLLGHGYKPLGREHPETSIGWYRRVFQLPATDAGQRVSIEFDGVFRDAMVTLNGQYLGRNMSGYAPFAYDVTTVANFGGPNVLVVRVDATEYEGWFYEGAGIYRHVWLVKTNPVRVPQWGVFVRSEPVLRNGAAESAALTIETEIDNHTDAATTCRVVTEVRDASGRIVATTRSSPARVEPDIRSVVTQHTSVDRPALWSIEHPQLYTLVTTVVNQAGEVLDRCETPFGIRSIHFDPDRGFFLNGTHVELKGTCNHQDHAGVGSALPDRLQAYRIEKLKAMGANAYRTSHNPPAPELLEACDHLGMLVLDEARMFSAEPEGLSQLERMIRRDRNHPSVFAWSIANEEGRVQGTDVGKRIGHEMRRLAHRLDPSRPVTAAMNFAYGTGLTFSLDVQGINYQEGDIDALHRNFPKLPIMGTETASSLATRGIYANDAERGYMSAYDVNHPKWGATAEKWWNFVVARPWFAGGFAWTGFDYRGEPTPYEWPCISSHFGIMDTCGFPKDTYYYYQAWWSDQPVLHLFPHWNWSDTEPRDIEVWVHSNLDRVELFLNGKSLGAKDVEANRHLSWTVRYAPGTLEARGYRNGAVVLTAKRETTGPATRVVVRADRSTIHADGEDVVVFDAQAVDAQGRFVPTADAEITFAVSGSGALIGVGNGDPSSHEADKADRRRLFNGRCVAIVQASSSAGQIRIEASSPGLAPGTAQVTCEPSTPRPSV